MNTSCQHNNVQFIGQFSLVGNYECRDCGEAIDPVEYAKMKGELNIQLLDYYRKNPHKLNPDNRNHPWVKHLYESST